MTAAAVDLVRDLVSDPRKVLREPQHREALHLTVNTAVLAVGGFLFWILLTRGLGVPAPTVGSGYAIVSLATAVAVVAKSGFDTAIVRHAPDASRSSAAHLLRLSVALGATVALALTLALAGAAALGLPLPELPAAGWALVLAIAALLVTTWMQDAYFVADRQARWALTRNTAFSAARLAAPVALVVLAAPYLVASAWTLALAASALLGVLLARRLPDRDGDEVSRKPFLLTTLRNVTSSAAEFLPGLFLAPIVLAVEGPEAAAYFGMAWAVAHMLFQVSSAISRSALVEFVEGSAGRHPEAVRRGVLQHLALVAPAAVAAILLAPHVLGVFGPRYAELGGLPFAILCASVLVVAPWYLYLAILRARERVVPLVLFPAATVAAVFALVPVLVTRYGLPGASMAWALANTPFGLWSTWRLYKEGQEVSPDGTEALGRRPHAG